MVERGVSRSSTWTPSSKSQEANDSSAMKAGENTMAANNVSKSSQLDSSAFAELSTR